MLEKIIRKLTDFPVLPRVPQRTERGAVAAVLVALVGNEADLEVVLTLRANHLNNHPGEVAFPGGMWDETDPDLLYTALREAEEEIALPPSLVEPPAMLPDSSPKRREMQVTPFVGLVRQVPIFVPEEREIDRVFSVPLSYLLERSRYGYFDLEFMGEYFPFPCVYFREYRIWGFTLRVLTDFLNQVFGAGIELRYPDEKRMRELAARQAVSR